MPGRRNPEKVVPLLLARLEQAKKYALEIVDKGNEEDLKLKFEEIETELDSLNPLFPKIKHFEEKLTEQFRTLEQKIDDDIFKEKDKIMGIFQNLDLIRSDVASIRLLFSAVNPSLMDRMMTMQPPRLQQYSYEETFEVPSMSEEWMRLLVEEKIFAGKSELNFGKIFYCLEGNQLKACSLSLSIFPENSIMKKRPLIYWWIGEGLVAETKTKSAEEVGEDVFKELIDEGFVIPKGEKFAPNHGNSFMVHPWIRRMLISVAKEFGFYNFDSTLTKPRNCNHRSFLLAHSDTPYGEMMDEETVTVFNFDKQYLGFKPDWLSKLNKVQVLQLGRWQIDVKHHIEVENEDSTFDPKKKKNKVEYEVSLDGLGKQKFLKYLSLRGVSRISTLPASLAKLESLGILDLRACHNLEKLPSGISSLRNLTHLDVSECYLLESMPKGIKELYALQVLKGFVIGNARENRCKLGDLSDLRNLRKLSIRIGGVALGEGEFANLQHFNSLQILAMSWGVVTQSSSTEAALKSLLVPLRLKKLDLRCFPMANAPEWLGPGKLTTLEKLYVRGGELRSFCGDEGHTWKVKYLILKYLKNFKIGEQELLAKFPDVEYVEKVKCNKGPQWTYDPDIIWDWETARDTKSTVTTI